MPANLNTEKNMSSLDQYLYDSLTWPEINEAVKAKKVILLPIGSTE